MANILKILSLYIQTETLTIVVNSLKISKRKLVKMYMHFLRHSQQQKKAKMSHFSMGPLLTQ